MDASSMPATIDGSAADSPHSYQLLLKDNGA